MLVNMRGNNRAFQQSYGRRVVVAGMHQVADRAVRPAVRAAAHSAADGYSLPDALGNYGRQ
jgi:hypothetical protein